MPRKSPNLNVRMPTCRNCHRHWRPAEGVSAKSSYCKRCAKERRAAAAAALGLRPLSGAEAAGPYLAPRHLRAS
jgi:hypothetical protein